MPETRPRTLGDRTGLDRTRTVTGSSVGEGLAAKVERIAANLGQSAQRVAVRSILGDAGRDYTLGEMGGSMTPLVLPKSGLWAVSVQASVTFDMTGDGRPSFSLSMTGGVGSGPVISARFDNGDSGIVWRLGPATYVINTESEGFSFAPSITLPSGPVTITTGSASINARHLGTR